MNLLYAFFTKMKSKFVGTVGQEVPSKSFLARIYASEGILFTLIITIAHNNNSLYASRLGAQAKDLALISSLPPVVGMLLLIPFTMFMGRLRNKRSVVILSIISLGLVYVMAGLSAFAGTSSVNLLIALLVIANIPMSIYNTSWQAFFSDVVPTGERNLVYGHRTRMNTAVGILVPLIAGGILTIAAGTGKVVVHQIYYFLTFPLALLQVYFLRKIPRGDIEQQRMTFRDLKAAAGALTKNRVFLGFMAVTLLVYCGWQMDWSIYFIAQFRYLNLNETGLSLIVVLGAVGQFIALGLWSRLAVKKGVRFVFFIGAAGFAFCAVTLVTALLMPNPANLLFYFLFQSIGSAAFSAFQLSLFQCLLETLPTEGRTLSIAIYNTIILASNILMPYLGAIIYRNAGETLPAMILAMAVIAGVRILATAAAFFRWNKKRKEPLPL